MIPVTGKVKGSVGRVFDPAAEIYGISISFPGLRSHPLLCPGFAPSVQDGTGESSKKSRYGDSIAGFFYIIILEENYSNTVGL